MNALLNVVMVGRLAGHLALSRDHAAAGREAATTRGDPSLIPPEASAATPPGHPERRRLVEAAHG